MLLGDPPIHTCSVLELLYCIVVVVVVVVVSWKLEAKRNRVAELS